MQATRQAHVGLFLLTSLTIGCGTSGGTRADALWREYRDTAREPSTNDDDAALFAVDQALERASLVRAVLARNPNIEVAREGLRGRSQKSRRRRPSTTR